MDDARFDPLARVVGAAPTRRTALRLLVSGLLGGLASALGLDHAGAGRPSRRCGGGLVACGRRCCARVAIRGFAFVPATVTIPAGAGVLWVNRDAARHTATADDGRFDSGLLGQGEAFRKVFAAPGRHGYHCRPHPDMQGTVVVTAS